MNSENNQKSEYLTLEQLRLENAGQSGADKPLPVDFLADAREGLNDFENTEQLNKVLRQINSNMHQQLKHKKTHKLTAKIWDLTWTYWTIVIILILCITAFLVIRNILIK